MHIPFIYTYRHIWELISCHAHTCIYLRRIFHAICLHFESQFHIICSSWEAFSCHIQTRVHLQSAWPPIQHIHAGLKEIPITTPSFFSFVVAFFLLVSFLHLLISFVSFFRCCHWKCNPKTLHCLPRLSQWDSRSLSVHLRQWNLS